MDEAKVMDENFKIEYQPPKLNIHPPSEFANVQNKIFSTLVKWTCPTCGKKAQEGLMECNLCAIKGIISRPTRD